MWRQQQSDMKLQGQELDQGQRLEQETGHSWTTVPGRQGLDWGAKAEGVRTEGRWTSLPNPTHGAGQCNAF